MTDPRVEVIEGRRTLVIERTPPVPSDLRLMLEGGRDAAGRTWVPIRVLHSQKLVIGGARGSCLGQDHRLSGWLIGAHLGSDGITRRLALYACADCGAVCVRDQSLDTLDRLPTGPIPLRRKDHVLAWYSGARPSNRTYGRNLA